eukprot:TRINITY_DN7431_c0_g1_i1.p1 TRINITY_DN7431_c0_g1~~TRINITY_DN7431_c0_g1_i1.p1  ORF type:complete len:207 (+),score=24.36 TRINITY_DN7431_c0_g1_i1:75-695(+)
MAEGLLTRCPIDKVNGVLRWLQEWIPACFALSPLHACIADKKVGEVVQPIFISVDPDRDTLPKIKEYVEREPFTMRACRLAGSCPTLVSTLSSYQQSLRGPPAQADRIRTPCRHALTSSFLCLEFHPRLLGLTGTHDQIKHICRKFRVYYSRPEPDGSDDYLVDHSIIQYLMAPDGTFTAYFGQNMTEEQMIENIQAHIKAYNAEH